MCEWKLRPHMTRDDIRPLMDVFAKRSLLPGTILTAEQAVPSIEAFLGTSS